MIKIIAVGDVHGQWPALWRVLKASSACDHQFEPTAPVIEGRYQVICVGDLVHYKDERAYAQAVGEEPYDPANQSHLRRAAKAQIRDLYRFKDYVDRADGNVTVILGNHDDSALTHEYELSTRGGLKHDEFNTSRGGVELPADLQDWFRTFERERVFHGVQFAHAGPLPGMQQFDDFFYHDRDTKHWWYEKPDLVNQVGHRFGVYGHTVMKEGIYVDKENNFAMIDALDHLQFLEMIVSEERLDYQVMQL
jgi:hypothetical protein